MQPRLPRASQRQVTGAHFRCDLVHHGHKDADLGFRHQNSDGGFDLAIASSPLSVTLIWNFTTSDYEQISNEPSYTAYITSNCTVKDIYTVTSSTGTYNLQFFESAYQGSVLAFYLNANIHGRNVFFGMSTVRAMNVSQPPVNSTASLTEPLQVSLTWASPIVGVESDRRLPSVQTEMDRRSGGRVRQTDRQRQRDTNTETETEQRQSDSFLFSLPFSQRRPSVLRRRPPGVTGQKPV